MRDETETVSERLERLNAALEDVRRSVAKTNEASQRLFEELLRGSAALPPPRARHRDTIKRRRPR